MIFTYSYTRVLQIPTVVDIIHFSIHIVFVITKFIIIKGIVYDTLFFILLLCLVV